VRWRQQWVQAGAAAIHNANGKVLSIKLVQSASSHAHMIGPATGDWRRPRFVVREKLDGGLVLWRHHGRATDNE
jgi:hypothetical protein